jgi:hypothetical protein
MTLVAVVSSMTSRTAMTVPANTQHSAVNKPNCSRNTKRDHSYQGQTHGQSKHNSSNNVSNTYNVKETTIDLTQPKKRGFGKGPKTNTGYQ